MAKLITRIGAVGTIAVFLCGCMDSLANQTKKSPNSIIGKKTDKIEKFDPNAKQKVSDSKVHADDPVLYPLQAYGPMVEKISKLQIEHALNIFHAVEDRWPKDYEEFMAKIIKANAIQLPVLPGGLRYAYDVENHKLEVIGPPEQAQPGAPAQPPAK